jgi:hypothetical protein
MFVVDIFAMVIWCFFRGFLEKRAAGDGVFAV